MSIFRFNALPSDRSEFKRNEIPLAQSDIRHIAQVCGPVVAANAEVVVQLIREQGGVNPNAVKFVFPSLLGIEGPVDEAALELIIANYSTWYSPSLPEH